MMPSSPLTSPDAAAGPLVVSTTNPRYFTVASGDDAHRKVVYLTGSHIWNNFHDGMGPGAECPETPEQFDYDAYLTFLKDHAHNFIRLLRRYDCATVATVSTPISMFARSRDHSCGAAPVTMPPYPSRQLTVHAARAARRAATPPLAPRRARLAGAPCALPIRPPVPAATSHAMLRGAVPHIY